MARGNSGSGGKKGGTPGGRGSSADAAMTGAFRDAAHAAANVVGKNEFVQAFFGASGLGKYVGEFSLAALPGIRASMRAATNAAVDTRLLTRKQQGWVEESVESFAEQLKDVLIMLSIVKERMPGGAKFRVLRYVKLGIIGLDQIANHDMVAMARLWLRARRLRQEIALLEAASRRRQERQSQAWLTVPG